MKTWTPTAKVTATLLLVAVTSAALGFVANTLIKSPQQLIAEAEPPPPSDILAQVEHGTIEKDIPATGEVTLGNTIDVTPTAEDGIGNIVTRLFVHAGDEIRPGMALFEIADRPVLLLPGNIPLLRDLTVEDTGPDVTRLQQSLENIGHPIEDREGYFGYSTHLALSNLYEDNEYEPPLAEDSYYTVAKQSELVLAPVIDTAQVVSTQLRVGQPSKTPAVTITTEPLVVNLKLQQAETLQLSTGMSVELISEHFTETLPATITSIGALEKNDEGASFIPVIVTPETPLPPQTLGANVRALIALPTTQADGLLVPLAAIWSQPDGNTVVTRVENERHTTIEIDVLDTGDGRALIAAPEHALGVGDSVLIGST